MLVYGFPHSGSSPSTQEHSFSTMQSLSFATPAVFDGYRINGNPKFF